MSIADDHLRICQMMLELTLSWPLQRMNRSLLADIEVGGQAGDPFLQNIEREIHRHLTAVKSPEDLAPIGQAYAAYAEAAIYMHFKNKGIQLQRTPGTGGQGQQRPDFLYPHQSGDIYFEVKCLDFQGGDLRHKDLAYNALEAASELDVRARSLGVHFGTLEISSFSPGATPADRIETLIKKIRGNAKVGQLAFGPCILIVDLGRLTPEAQHPCCLLPVYYNEGMPAEACASGELWHVALGRIGDTIYRLPEFEGKGNLDRQLREQGILYDYPELLGISFILPRLSGSTEIYSIWNVAPEFGASEVPCRLAEHEIGDLINSYSDAMNDNNNIYEDQYVRRP